MRYELYLHASEVIPLLTITFFLPKISQTLLVPVSRQKPGPWAACAVGRQRCCSAETRQSSKSVT